MTYRLLMTYCDFLSRLLQQAEIYLRSNPTADFITIRKCIISELVNPRNTDISNADIQRMLMIIGIDNETVKSGIFHSLIEMKQRLLSFYQEIANNQQLFGVCADVQKVIDDIENDCYVSNVGYVVARIQDKIVYIEELLQYKEVIFYIVQPDGSGKYLTPLQVYSQGMYTNAYQIGISNVLDQQCQPLRTQLNEQSLMLLKGIWEKNRRMPADYMQSYIPAEQIMTSDNDLPPPVLQEQPINLEEEIDLFGTDDDHEMIQAPVIASEVPVTQTQAKEKKGFFGLFSK